MVGGDVLEFRRRVGVRRETYDDLLAREVEVY
jgi:hypothetical protein